MKISKETAEHYVWGNQCDGWRLLDRPDLAVTQERMPAGMHELCHLHQKARQFFFVLKGTATMECAGRRVTLSANEGVEIPPNMLHQIFNESQADVEFLVVSEPTTRGDRILSQPDESQVPR